MPEGRTAVIEGALSGKETCRSLWMAIGEQAQFSMVGCSTPPPTHQRDLDMDVTPSGTGMDIEPNARPLSVQRQGWKLADSAHSFLLLLARAPLPYRSCFC